MPVRTRLLPTVLVTADSSHANVGRIPLFCGITTDHLDLGRHQRRGSPAWTWQPMS
ncbi:hypothetical protein [Streptomyces goshikiensis]|uniref:hypothetical protein n=1 Tax=Streptomyces goshikiensis TaxID=1942 RepID=UPI0036CA76A5